MIKCELRLEKNNKIIAVIKENNNIIMKFMIGEIG